MRMRTSVDCFNTFYRKIHEGNITVGRINRAHQQGHLIARDVELTYNSILLTAIVSFELLVEDLFYSLLANQINFPRNYTQIQSFSNVETAKKIVLQGGRYMDWLPIEKLEKHSDIYFVDPNNPFKVLNRHQKQEIQKVLYIRNYIAHQSEHSQKLFEQHVIGTTLLPRGPRRLLRYYRSTHAGPTNKFEYHLGELVTAARVIAT